MNMTNSVITLCLPYTWMIRYHKTNLVKQVECIPVLGNWRNEKKNPYLLLFGDSQTGTGHRKLYNKDYRQDGHVLSSTVKEPKGVL